MKRSHDALTSLGLPDSDAVQPSKERFPDGAEFRIEIPSTESARALRAALEEAERLDCPVHRFSQGSGIQMLSDAEIKEICVISADHGVEFCAFVTPRANFDTGALWSAPAGKAVQWQLRGADQLRYALDDIFRAVDLGLRSVLVSDLGLLAIVRDLKAAGKLPKNLVVKTSALMAPANPATARLLEELGATTINLATDLSVAQFAAVRRATKAPIDVYVEAPDGLGGFVRHHETPDIIRFAAPVYVKLGLRNTPDIYPAGQHIEATVVALSRERVRRSRLVMDLVAREYPEARWTRGRAPDLGIPEP